MGYDSFTVKRELGTALSAARLARGMSAAAAGVVVGCSQPTMWRVEKGNAPVTSRQLTLLARAYEVDETEHRRWQQMLLDITGGDRWWNEPYGKWLTPQYAELIEVENSATSLTTVQLSVVPGLLQTSAYTRALFGGSLMADPDRSEALMEVRRLRQRRIAPGVDSAPLVVKALFTEAVLDYRYGAADVHRNQLRHLLDLSGQPNISINVIPYERMTDLSSYDLYEFEDGSLPVIYTESILRTVSVESRYPQNIRQAKAMMTGAGARALSVQESARLIEEKMEKVS